MSVTTFQQLTKPADREALLEIFLQQHFEDLGAALGNAYIEGLQIEWVSVSSIKIKTGAADVPDGSRRIRVTSDITVSSISLGNNTWGHAYLYNNAGVPTVEVVTTAPVKYFGTAYQKTSDATRRYLGSIRTDGSGNIVNFLHDTRNNFMRYRGVIVNSPQRVLSNGTATSATDVDCSAVVPVTSKLALARASNSSATGIAWFGSSESITPTASSGTMVLTTQRDTTMALELNAPRVFKYIYDVAPTNGLYVEVYGYWFER